MPSVFLSYSQADLKRVQQLEEGLKEAKVLVWRDQEKLYGGQKWPKALGEAIAKNDLFLLAWSKNADTSHFVEFEWNTAVALKKTIIPCLLDNTALPASLSADQGVDAREPATAVAGILNALQSPERDPVRAKAVLARLDAIQSTDEKKVVKEATAIFSEQKWTVQGGYAIQAGRDVHITIAGTPARADHEPPPTKSTKSLLGKWQAWAALIVAVLTAIGLAADLPGKLGFPIFSDPDDQLLDQPLAGWIRDRDTDLPIAGVDVTLQYSAGMTVQTNKDGYFSFPPVHAPKQETVTLLVKKEEYDTLSRQFLLGNIKIKIPMKKTKK